MKPKDFEQAVLELAMTTRVPLTRANVLFYTGAGSKQAEKWLTAMVADGLLDFDSDDDGEMLYTVRGAKRPSVGPTELTRCAACGKATLPGSRCLRCGQMLDPHLRALRNEIDRETRGGSARPRGDAAGTSGMIDPRDASRSAIDPRGASRSAIDRAGSTLTLFRRSNELRDLLKAPQEGEKSLLAGGLLGLLGPIGWLYSAPLREAVPAAAVFFLVMWGFPSLFFLLMAMLPLLPVSALVGALYAWKHNRAGRRSGLVTEDDPGAAPR